MTFDADSGRRPGLSAADREAIQPPLLSRERAILEFNRRVLAQAQRDDVPMLERLRYVCIVSSNMDEFFEVRFADYLEAARQPGAPVSSQRSGVGRRPTRTHWSMRSTRSSTTR